MKNSTIENYLKDLIFLLKENALKAVVEKKKLAYENLKEYNYSLGYLMAYHEVISLLQQQAMAFGISLESLGLHDIDPEKDLL